MVAVVKQIARRCEISLETHAIVVAQRDALLKALAAAHAREHAIGGYLAPAQQAQVRAERALIVECGGSPSADDQRYELARDAWARRDA